jgi:hypothetical protein
MHCSVLRPSCQQALLDVNALLVRSAHEHRLQPKHMVNRLVLCT